MNYLKIYEDIISKTLLENRIKGDKYYESHHIYPESWRKSDLEYLIKDKRNLVLLTAKEHYTVHHLLVRVYPDDISMTCAFWGMTNKNRNKHKVTSRNYETAKKAQAKYMSGRVVSEETKKKQSNYWKGRCIGEKNYNYGNKWSVEQRERMSQQRKGLTLSNSRTNGEAITPWGTFRSLNAAVQNAPKPISFSTLSKFCKQSNEVVKKSNLQYTNYLTEENIGKTFSELGYGYNTIEDKG